MTAIPKNSVHRVFLAYYLGTSFVAALVIFAGGFPHPGLFIAPLSIPFFLGFGTGEILKTGEPAEVIDVLCVGCLSSMAVFGCWGLLKSWNKKTFVWWPILLLILNTLLFFVMFDALAWIIHREWIL